MKGSVHTATYIGGRQPLRPKILLYSLVRSRSKSSQIFPAAVKSTKIMCP
jgi:hypothetical protein